MINLTFLIFFFNIQRAKGRGCTVGICVMAASGLALIRKDDDGIGSAI